tara:strand:- start:423 stop:734 length:312 start_codon:yes stop_codon:yes gene_type:complete
VTNFSPLTEGAQAPSEAFNMQLAKLTISIAIPESARNVCPTDDDSIDEFCDALDSIDLDWVINAALKEHMVFGNKTPWIEYLEYTVDDGFEKTTSSCRSILTF